MKKTLVLVAVIMVVVSMLASCSDHTHSFGEWEIAKNATCTEDGAKARYCDCGEKQTESIPRKGHTGVVLEAISATCITEGKTEGKKCSDCGEILVEQTKTDALGHKEVVDAGTDATCTATGLTEGKHCSRCDEIIVAQTVINVKGHTEVIDKAIAPTCIATGLTEGKHCSVCKEVLVKQGVVPIVSHSYDDKYDDSCNVCGGIRDTECAHREIEVVPGYASTCTDPGLTNGQKCKKCGEVITHQTVINSKGHTEVLDEAIAATCISSGLTEGKHCSTCDKVLVEQGVVPALPHTYGEWVVTKTANCGQDGEMTRSCSCGAKQTEVIYGSGMHGEVIDLAVDPTCGATGLTEGKHCPYCNAVFVKQEVVPSLEHQYDTTYSFDGSFHWYACKNCDIKKDIAEHQEGADEGMCSECDQPIGPTEGIIYDKSDDGTYAIVVEYQGDAKKIRIADTYQGLPVKTIYNGAFGENETITSVIIPDSVTSIGSAAFSDCKSLTSVVIPDGVTSIGNYAFSFCRSLTSIEIPDSVTSIGNSAFYNCSGLMSIEIPDSVTSIGSSVFYCCTRLSSVVIPDSVTSISSGAFDYCTSLRSVVIPDSVTSIGSGAFRDCTSLSSVVIPDSVASIGSGAFNGCSKLQFNEYENCKYLGSKDNPYYVLIALTTKNLSNYTIHEDTKVIADNAFSSCSRLASIVSPDSITSIGVDAFENCSSLSSIAIGNGIAFIGNSAFYKCSSLKNVYYTGSEAEWKAITIGASNSNLTKATIHYNYVPEN